MDTPANQKAMIVLGRQLRRSDGRKTGLTFEYLSESLGHKDRQWSHNYWREFESCEGDLLRFLKRDNKLEERAFSKIEQQILDNPVIPLSEQYERFSKEHPEICLCEGTFRSYVGRIDCGKLLRRIRSMLRRGEVCLDSKRYLQELLETLPLESHKKKEIVTLFPQVEAKEPVERVVWNSSKSLLVVFLYACGLPLEVLGLLFGASKSSIHNWVYGVCTLGFEQALLGAIQYWSGKVSFDEKWIRINGVWHFILAAVDALTGFPLLMSLHTTIDTQSWEVFFCRFRAVYGKPSLIQSDGSKSLLAAKKKVFSGVVHQLCMVHKLRNLLRVIFSRLTDDLLRGRCVRLSKGLFKNRSVSSRKQAAKTLQKQAPGTVSDYVQEHILDCWRQLTHALTVNVSERFNRKLEKCIHVRYGIQTQESAKVLLRALWFKEMLLHGKQHLAQTHPLRSLQLSRLCQEHLSEDQIQHFFKHSQFPSLDAAA